RRSCVGGGVGDRYDPDTWPDYSTPLPANQLIRSTPGRAPLPAAQVVADQRGDARARQLALVGLVYEERLGQPKGEALLGVGKADGSAETGVAVLAAGAPHLAFRAFQRAAELIAQRLADAPARDHVLGVGL